MAVATRRKSKAGAPAAPDEKPTEAAFRALTRTCGLLGRAMQPFFVRFGITVSQYAVLRTLCRAETEFDFEPGGGPRGLRQTELGERLLVRPPSVTGAIDRLERMGLVCRGPSPDDQRAKYVRLTDTGRRLVDRVGAEHARRIGTVLGALSVSEQKQLNRLLGRLGTHLSALCDGQDAEAGMEM